MEIIGVTIFSVIFAYLKVEREDNFSWYMDSLKCLMHGHLMSSIVVTDRDLALLYVVERTFLTSRHFLCIWHIKKKHCWSLQENL